MLILTSKERKEAKTIKKSSILYSAWDVGRLLHPSSPGSSFLEKKKSLIPPFWSALEASRDDRDICVFVFVGVSGRLRGVLLK